MCIGRSCQRAKKKGGHDSASVLRIAETCYGPPKAMAAPRGPSTCSRFDLRVNGPLTDVVRFSISSEGALLARFDTLIARKGYGNRSEAIRDLIRNALVEEVLANESAEAVGTVTLMYDHHVAELSNTLTDHQHHHHRTIVSTLHIHLDDHDCLEVVVLRGRAGEIRALADSLISTKGVKHGRFVATAATSALVPDPPPCA